MFTVKVCSDFSAAHALRGYVGNCARVHGHNWKVEVALRVGELDDIGISVDFRTIRKQTKNIIAQLDHQFINEIKPFDMINPTAENLAKYFFQTLVKQFNTPIIRVADVTIWETDRAGVSYAE